MKTIKVAILIAVPLIAGLLVFVGVVSYYGPGRDRYLAIPWPGHSETPKEVMEGVELPDWVLEWQQFGEADIAPGRRLYEANCAACHGKEADGKGDWAEAFNMPAPPPNLVEAVVGPLAHHPVQYVFWRINEGGIQNAYNSAMPAWGSFRDGDAVEETVHGGDLSNEEVWEVIRYLYTKAELEPLWEVVEYTPQRQ